MIIIYIYTKELICIKDQTFIQALCEEPEKEPTGTEPCTPAGDKAYRATWCDTASHHITPVVCLSVLGHSRTVVSPTASNLVINR